LPRRRLTHLSRALLAAAVTLIAGIVECATGRAIPAAISLPLLVIACAAVRTFRSSDPAARIGEPFGFGAMVLPVIVFAAWGLGGHDLNTREVIDWLIFAVLAVGGGVFVAAALVAGASAIASVVFERRVLAERRMAGTVAAAVAILALAALVAAAILTASRHPTARAWVARQPIAGELQALSHEPDKERGQWGDIVVDEGVDCGDFRVRRVRFTHGGCAFAATTGQVRPEHRGEPGDFGDVYDWCSPVRVRCAAAQKTAILELPSATAFLRSGDDGAHNYPVGPIRDMFFALPHVWIGGALIALAAAIALLTIARRAGLAALAAILGAAPLAVALAMGRLVLSSR
jgi:hypothetical protein